MKINPDIFKTYDIRAKFPKEVNTAVAELIGNTAALFLAKKSGKKKVKILLCRDVRASSPVLFQSLSNGIVAQGSDVLDAGVGTTPFFYFLMQKIRPDGGIMITASHNPAAYNGFKIRDKNNNPVSLGAGLEIIKKLVLRQKKQWARMEGKYLQLKNDYDNYIKFLTAGFSINKIKTVIDAGGGSAVFLLPKLMDKFPQVLYKPLFFEPDGTFKKHSPNPLLPVSQKYIKEELKKGGYRFGAVFDGDGDRVLFFDEKGETVRPEYIFALLVGEFLKRHPKSTFIMPVNTSRAVREYIKEQGGIIKLSPVGYTYIRPLMKKFRAPLAVEASGHFFFKKFFYNDSALLAWLELTSFLSKNPRPLSQMIKPLERYFSSGELNFKIKDKKGAILRLKKHYKRGKIKLLDGISVDFPDWWFNIRPSNTEPLIRLVMEAKSENLLNIKLKEVESIIKGR